MSEQQRQHLSALADGELDAMTLQTTLSALAGSDELQAVWERYHLIGNALHGDAVRPEYRQIAGRVRACTAAEPVPLRTLKARPVRENSRSGAFLGAALAASAAFLAVFAVPQLFDAGPAAPKGSASLIALGAATPPAPMPERFELHRGLQRWHVNQPALESKLDRFLVNHQEYATAPLKGMLPYATFVGYEAGR